MESADAEIDHALAEAAQLEGGLAAQHTLASCGRNLEEPLRRMVALRQQALRASRAARGDTHAASLAILDQLAEATATLGDVADASRYAAAEALYAQALELRALSLGHEHPDSVASAARLWGFYLLAFRLLYLLAALAVVAAGSALAFLALPAPATPAAAAQQAALAFAPYLVVCVVPRAARGRVGLMLALSARCMRHRAVARWQAAESCACGCCCCCRRHGAANADTEAPSLAIPGEGGGGAGGAERPEGA